MQMYSMCAFMFHYIIEVLDCDIPTEQLKFPYPSREAQKVVSTDILHFSCARHTPLLLVLDHRGGGFDRNYPEKV